MDAKTNERDPCALCGGSMKGKRSHAVYCTRACKVRARDANPAHQQRKTARRRERLATDSEFRERMRQRDRERYAFSADRRARLRSLNKARYAEKVRIDPAYRDKQNARWRERMANDPQARVRRRLTAKKWTEHRLATDPGFRDRINQSNRRWKLKNKLRKSMSEMKQLAGETNHADNT